MFLLFYLAFLLQTVLAEHDCVAGPWGTWTGCRDTGLQIFTLQSVGQQSRERDRLEGKHCLKSDLVEIRLCWMESGEAAGEAAGDAAGDAAASAQDIIDEADTEEEVGETEAPSLPSEVTAPPAPLEAAAGVQTSLVQPPAVHLGSFGEVLYPNSNDPKEARTVLVVLLTVTTVLLLSGLLLGLILVKQHKRLQRKHKILVMTRERIRLLDSGEKQLVRSGGLCGVPASMFCGTTVRNPAYWSDEEDTAETEEFPMGQLKLEIQ